jgi:hypothetical protein
MRTPSCVCLCLFPSSTFVPLSRFYKIHYEGHAIEGDLNAVVFNPVV